MMDNHKAMKNERIDEKFFFLLLFIILTKNHYLFLII